MRRTSSSARGWVAHATALSLIVSSIAPAVAQAPKPVAAATKPAAATAKPAAAQAPVTAAPDGGWPRQFVTDDGGALVMYQPQIEKDGSEL